MHPAESQLERAGRFLTGLIDDHRLRGVPRLPTMHELARRAGVSRETMGKAVAALKRSGVLAVSQRSGIRIAEHGSGAIRFSPPSPSVYAWQGVAERLTDDIWNGRYAAGRKLPGTQVLQGSYGACYRSVKKALEALCRKGLVERSGRGYAVVDVRAPTTHQSVVLAVRGAQPGIPGPAMFPMAEETLYGFQKEGPPRGVAVKAVPFGFTDNKLLGPGGGPGPFVDQRERESTLGFACALFGTAPHILLEFIHHLESYGRPVAALDPTGSLYHASDPVPLGRNTRLFSLATGSRVGSAVGRHLAALGHRHVAYISPEHRLVWSRERLMGLREALASAGGTVSAFTRSGRRRLASGVERESWSTALGKRIERAEGLVESADPELGGAFNQHRQLLRETVNRQLTHAVLDELFDRALSDVSITAWVAANDATALRCLSFLREQGRKVPRDISVIGFDDSAEAFAWGLASYDFNVPALVQGMLSHVLHPYRRFGGRAPEIEGSVVVRETLGPVTAG